MNKNWYTFYTKSRAEKKTAELLNKKGYEVFLPLVTVVRQWSDRKKKVQTPLFNSYLFVNIFEYQVREILEVPGVAWSVTLEGKPAVLRLKEKEIIERILSSGYSVEVEGPKDFTVGTDVKIIDGSLKGLKGKVVKTNPDQVSIELDSIDQSLRVTVTPNILESIKKTVNNE